MFKKFYTTQMSGSAKMLQKRFTEIRRRRGRAARLAAAIMSAVMAVSMLAVTAAMAAIGADGLEYWDRDEIYFQDGATFVINVSGKKVPQWVYEDITDKDGNISVTINRYECRSAGSGEVTPTYTITLSGSKGIARLSCNKCGRGIADNDFPYYRKGSMSFSEEIYAINYPFRKTGPTDVDSGKRRYAYVQFGVDENRKTQAVIGIKLCNGVENAPYNPADMKEFDFISPIPNTVYYIGNFAADAFYYETWNPIFTFYEKNYQNRHVKGVDLSITQATENAIDLRSEVTVPNADHIRITVWNNDGYRVSWLDKQEVSGTDALNVKAYDHQTAEEKADKFIKGQIYRVCVGIYDSENRLIYRWQEYATVE